MPSQLGLLAGCGTLDAWIDAVARHQASRHARRRTKRQPGVLTPDLAAILLDPAASPVTAMERKQRQELVQAVIAELGKSVPVLRHRIVLEYWINEKSPSAIAGELDVAQERSGQ